MHIAVVTACITSGGAERVISQLVNEWVKMDDVECTLILLHKEPLFYYIDSKVKIKEIGVLNTKHYIDKFLKYKHVRDIVNAIKPDIVLSLPEEIGIYVIGALLGTGVPVVVSERNNPKVMPYKKETRILRDLLYPFVNGLVFQTQGAMSYFPKKIQENGVILPNPLDLNRLPQPYLGKREKVIVGVGRLEKQKNFKLLIDSFCLFWREHRDYKLVIYGEGVQRNELEEYIKCKECASNIELPGRHNNVLEKIKTASVFVLSSDYEGVPNALIEAMAIGLPCVATDCAPGGAAALIDNEVNGFLIPAKDVSAMQLAMHRIIEDIDIAQKFSRNGLKIKKIFDSRIVAQEWLEYLRSKLL